MKLFLSKLLIVFSIISVKATEVNVNEFLESAKEAYINEEYAYAIELYEEIISLGYESPYLYYNLANAYFKDNKFGRAILNYERAKKILPNNEEVLHNLRIANTRIVDKIDTVPEIFYYKWWKSIINMQNSDSWAKTAITFLFLFFGAFVFYVFSKKLIIKKIGFYTALILAFFVILSFIFANRYNKFQLSENTGIIMTVRTTAKSSPSPTSPDVFVIHEGTKVKIINDLGIWFEIRLANGNIGWIEKNTLELI